LPRIRKKRNIVQTMFSGGPFKFTFGVGDDWNFLLVAKCIETVARVTYISFFCFDQSLAAEAAFSIVRKVEKSVNLLSFLKI